MRPRVRGRLGVATVIGTMLFVIVLMAGLGAVAYDYSLQVQSSQAAQQAQQLVNQRNDERLSFSGYGSTLTLRNTGAASASLVSVIIKFTNGTVYNTTPTVTALPLSGSAPLLKLISPSAACGSTSCANRASAVIASSNLGNVGILTSLGNTFLYWPLTGMPPGPSFSSMQVFHSAQLPSYFFVANGSSLYEYSVSSGALVWRVSPGAGSIVNVMPISSGYVFAEDGYFDGQPWLADLLEISPSGSVVHTFQVRLLRTHMQQEFQYPDEDALPWPIGIDAPWAGSNSTYAVYDGWLYSQSGTSRFMAYGDEAGLLGTDSSWFYTARTYQNSGTNGCNNPYGDIVAVTAEDGGAQPWSTRVNLGYCSLYPQTLISSSVNGGMIVSLWGNPYYPEPGYYVGPFAGSNPYLAVVSTSGAQEYEGQMDQAGYTSVATDGTYVYLANPVLSEIERVTIISGARTTYPIAIQPLEVICSNGYVIAVSQNGFNVYDSSMNLVKSVSFGSSNLYSLTNSFQFQSSMQAPSFVILSPTTYAALVRTSQGYGELITGQW